MYARRLIKVISSVCLTHATAQNNLYKNACIQCSGYAVHSICNSCGSYYQLRKSKIIPERRGSNESIATNSYSGVPRALPSATWNILSVQ